MSIKKWKIAFLATTEIVISKKFLKDGNNCYNFVHQALGKHSTWSYLKVVFYERKCEIIMY
jgi:hypothetical protein